VPASPCLFAGAVGLCISLSGPFTQAAYNCTYRQANSYLRIRLLTSKRSEICLRQTVQSDRIICLSPSALGLWAVAARGKSGPAGGEWFSTRFPEEPYFCARLR
jgi:hypothetical protein